MNRNNESNSDDDYMSILYNSNSSEVNEEEKQIMMNYDKI